MYKKVVLSNPNPNTEVGLQDVSNSGGKLYVGINQPNGVAGLIAENGDDGLVIFNLNRLFNSDVLSPADPNGNPIEFYPSIKSAILASGNSFTWYQVNGMMGLSLLYKEKGLE